MLLARGVGAAAKSAASASAGDKLSAAASLTGRAALSRGLFSAPPGCVGPASAAPGSALRRPLLSAPSSPFVGGGCQIRQKFANGTEESAPWLKAIFKQNDIHTNFKSRQTWRIPVEPPLAPWKTWIKIGIVALPFYVAIMRLMAYVTGGDEPDENVAMHVRSQRREFKPRAEEC